MLLTTGRIGLLGQARTRRGTLWVGKGNYGIGTGSKILGFLLAVVSAGRRGTSNMREDDALYTHT